MSRLFPKPKPAFEEEYESASNRSNLKYVMFFSALGCFVFLLHLLHHFRLGMKALSAEMMPYTMLYSFAVIYTAITVGLLYKLKDVPALLPVTRFIEHLFPFFMGALAVILSVLSANFGLGITPFAALMMLLCFTLQGQYVLLCTAVSLGFWLLSAALILTTPVEVYSPLIAMGLTTTIACLVIANITEKQSVDQFENVSMLNSTNRQLQLLSQQDHLTKLLNRRAIDQSLERELSRSERFDHSLSLLMIDVDNFKHINDAYGHVFGDEVLVSIASAIQRHVRDIDYVGRIGGDEFVVVLIETSHTDAIQIADRMRNEVLKIDKKYPDITISISIGHAMSEGESHIALIEKADKALYLAKKAGKNKVRSLFANPIVNT